MSTGVENEVHIMSKDGRYLQRNCLGYVGLATKATKKANWKVETNRVGQALTYSFKAKGHYLACSKLGRIKAGKKERGKSAHWAVVTDGGMTLGGPSGTTSLVCVGAAPLILAVAAGGIAASIHGAAAWAAFHGLGIAVQGVTQVLSVLAPPKKMIRST